MSKSALVFEAAFGGLDPVAAELSLVVAIGVWHRVLNGSMVELIAIDMQCDQGGVVF